jgi:hypothetical protein
MKITNVRWGLMGEPFGQRCLYFDLDGRPASVFFEQKQGVVESGYLSIDFEDDKSSHLPIIQLFSKGEPRQVLTQSDRFVKSAWLMSKYDEMCMAEPFEEGRVIGDAPEEGA